MFLDLVPINQLTRALRETQCLGHEGKADCGTRLCRVRASDPRERVEGLRNGRIRHVLACAVRCAWVRRFRREARTRGRGWAGRGVTETQKWFRPATLATGAQAPGGGPLAPRAARRAGRAGRPQGCRARCNGLVRPSPIPAKPQRPAPCALAVPLQLCSYAAMQLRSSLPGGGPHMTG